MFNEVPCNLTIITSMAKAIKLHPLTHCSSNYELFYRKLARNSFLENFNICFQEPLIHQATFKSESYVPNQLWFGLFSDEEKETVEDECGFYGMMYRTDVKVARKRAKKMLEKTEEALAAKLVNTQAQKEGHTQAFYQRDAIKDMYEAIGCFDLADEITLTFIFSEWPDMEQMKKTDYVKEFEAKLLKKMSGLSNEGHF